ncbi:MAG: DnaJ domain-containing protein [Dehalococcoidia bacterium]
MRNPESDHYATLDLPRTATQDEIKRRYRRLMREVHPDANVSDPEATRKAARINHAFETLGDPVKRRTYDEQRAPAVVKPRSTRMRNDRMYAHWAEQEDWEDIVAANVPGRRAAHAHSTEPLIAPLEIEVDMAELRASARVRRTIRITNRCACTLTGDVSTSEPWVWGPVGKLTAGPGETIEFPIEVVARKVTFPGIARALFVGNQWTGVIPVKIAGYEPTKRRVVPATDSAYVRQRRRRWTRR